VKTDDVRSTVEPQQPLPPGRCPVITPVVSANGGDPDPHAVSRPSRFIPSFRHSHRPISHPPPTPLHSASAMTSHRGGGVRASYWRMGGTTKSPSPLARVLERGATLAQRQAWRVSGDRTGNSELAAAVFNPRPRPRSAFACLQEPHPTDRRRACGLPPDALLALACSRP